MSNPLLNFLPNKFVLLSLTVASLILSQFEVSLHKFILVNTKNCRIQLNLTLFFQLSFKASLIRTSLTDHAILIVTGIPFLLLSFFVVYKKEQELIGFVRNDLIKSKKT